MSSLVSKETVTGDIAKMLEDFDKNKTLTNPHQYEEEEWTDYPYIGIGKKPYKSKHPTEEQLERIIGG